MSAIIHEGLTQPVEEELVLAQRDYSPLPPAVKIDSLIDDRYLYSGEVLGRGAQAKVIKAVDTDTDKPVAIKLPAIATPKAMARFQREVELTAGFTEIGQSVPSFIGAGIDTCGNKSFAYMATEVKKESLSKRLAVGKLSVEGIVKAVRPAFGALDTAHALGIAHRDVKPPNILLDDNGEGSLADWGIAATVRTLAHQELEQCHLSPGVVSRSLEEPGSIVGAIVFSAPEQVLDGASYSISSEVFAAGVVLYMMQSHGRAPWGNHADIESYVASLVKSSSGRRIKPIDLTNFGISSKDPLKQVTDSCLEHDPANRPKQIDEINKVLDLL